MELTRQLLAHLVVLFALQGTTALKLLLTLLTIHAPWGTTVHMGPSMLLSSLALWAHSIPTMEQQILVNVSSVHLVAIALVKALMM